MTTRQWVQLAVMILPVLLLTALNVSGLRPSPELAAALAALTTTAAALTQVRRQPSLAAARKRRSPNATRNDPAAPRKPKQLPPPSATVDPEHRRP